MCNYRGELSECSQSNFFMVRDGVALTPKSACRASRRDHALVPVRLGRDVGARGPRRNRSSRRTSTIADEALHHEHDARAEPRRRGLMTARSAPASRDRSRCGSSKAIASGRVSSRRRLEPIELLTRRRHDERPRFPWTRATRPDRCWPDRTRSPIMARTARARYRLRA